MERMITVNGQRRYVWGESASYDHLVKLAYGGPIEALATIGYSDGPNDSPEGTLTPGQSVRVVDGMIFDVDVT